MSITDKIILGGGRIVGFIETIKSCDTFHGKPVYSVEEICNVNYDEIHVANMYVETVQELLKRNIEKERIVLCNLDVIVDYVSFNNGVLDLRINSYNWPLILTRALNIKLPVPNCANLHAFNTNIILHRDYTRLATLRLLVNEINDWHISGDVAELGVYQGHFAQHINAAFPERKLYLFDTFTGFAQEEMKFDIEHGFLNDKWFDDNYNLANTSVDLVLKKMPYPEQCIICKGKFPDTIPSGEHKYALVSIDCDLYMPIFEGLKYFYTRLSDGGFIMLHEYNYDSGEVEGNFGGVKKAVQDFEAEYGQIVKVPITDLGGTVVIGK